MAARRCSITTRSGSVNTTPQGSFLGIMGELAEGERSINIGVVETEGETQVTINYNAKQ